MWQLMIIYYVWKINFGIVGATCTFPSNWDGEWYDSAFQSSAIVMNLTGSSIESGWTVNPYTQAVTSWTCQGEDTSEQFLIFRGDQEITLPGSFVVTAFRCIKWTKVTDYSYIYYVYAPVEANAEDQRIYMQLSSMVSTIDSGTYCDSAYTPGIEEFHMLVKSGHEADVQQMCSIPLLGEFNYTFYDGSAYHCGSDSSLDVCSNRTVMTFNYTACSQQQAYSSIGEVYCGHTVINGSIYYTAVINPETVDYTSTFKFTCYAVQFDDSTVLVSDSKGSCEAGQAPNTKQTDGTGTLVMTASITCVPTDADSTSATSSSSNIVPIIAAVVGVIVLIIIIVVVVCIYKRNCGKKENATPITEKEKEIEEPKSENSSTEIIENGTRIRNVEYPESSNTMDAIVIAPALPVTNRIPSISIQNEQQRNGASSNDPHNENIRNLINVSTNRITTIDDTYIDNRMKIQVMTPMDIIVPGKQVPPLSSMDMSGKHGFVSPEIQKVDKKKSKSKKLRDRSTKRNQKNKIFHSDDAKEKSKENRKLRSERVNPRKRKEIKTEIPLESMTKESDSIEDAKGANTLKEVYTTSDFDTDDDVTLDEYVIFDK